MQGAGGAVRPFGTPATLARATPSPGSCRGSWIEINEVKTAYPQRERRTFDMAEFAQADSETVLLRIGAALLCRGDALPLVLAPITD